MKSQRWIKCGEDEDEVDVEGEDADVDEMVKDERDAREEQHGEGFALKYGRRRWFPDAAGN